MRTISRVIFLVGILLSLNQCVPEKDTSHKEIDGKWQAEWLLIDEEMNKMFSPEEITMRGEVIFDEKEEVRITAFGFQGCIFAPDTATNKLIYAFHDSTLDLLNNEKEVVFSYQVKEKLPHQLTLLLLDDIQLTLRR